MLNINQKNSPENKGCSLDFRNVLENNAKYQQKKLPWKQMVIHLILLNRSVHHQIIFSRKSKVCAQEQHNIVP